MTLFERLSEIFTRDARKYAYVTVPRDQVANADYTETPLEAGKHYFRLWLTEMFLQRDVDWFTTWYPVAHSLVVCQFGNQTIEIPHIAGPSHIQGLDESHLERVISLNHPMTTLVPFDGGIVKLVVALVAMKGKDYVTAVAKVLGDLSKLLMTPQLSSALNIALPVATGIQDLLGGGTGQIHLGVHQTFTGQGGGGGILKTGYIAAIRGDAGDFPPERLWVSEGRLRIGNSFATSTPLTGITHMLFRVEGQTERDDWHGLKDISDAFAEALKYLSVGDEEKAKYTMKRVLFLVKMSPDLTRAHRNAVAIALREEFEDARNDGFAAIPMSERSLENAVLRRAPSADDALRDGVSLEALYDTSV